MTRTTGPWTRHLVATAATLTLVATATAVPATAQPRTAAGKSTPAVTVMTRNLYLGADIMRPIAATQAVPAEPAQTYQPRLIDALANATDATRDMAGRTDFATRVGLLAAELVEHRPTLVGLQEVALWRTGPMDDPTGAQLLVPNATTVEYDFLKMLRKELKAQGVPYRAVSVNTLSDVEAPAYEGSIMNPPTLQDMRDVRLTMRDVVLKRKGAPVEVLRHREREYSTNLSVDMAGRSMEFNRGYQWVDVRGQAGRFRFINTHLEAFSSDIAYAQAAELLAGPGDHRRTTILVCDCNSDPVNGSVKTGIGDTQPHWAPYWLLTGRNLFNDTWLQWRQAQEGWTSGLSEEVDDETPAGFDHRIDLVLARTGDGRRLKVVDGDVTGDELADRDVDSGLWPSDHAGVVMTLRGIG
jgi:hypothetical protein